ncbi:MAG: hypothetical protein HYV07_32645 [Deltaproteobacteria bacterium]|nr:hypothetical protein [Deltaproteobacteria bacterium]
MRSPRLTGALLSIFVAACAGAGARHFKEGERLQGAGRLDEAEKEYRTAVDKEPGNTKYKSRLEKVELELEAEVDKLLAAARDEEKSGDFTKAAEVYAKAVALRPSHAEANARRELSAAKAKNLGPGEWYLAVAAVHERFPRNKTVAKAFEGAKTAAYAYHRDQARSLLAADQASEALSHYRSAKQIDENTPGLDVAFVARAEALDIAEQGDLRMDAGDPAGAAELYQKALDRARDPEIDARLRKAKSAAGPLLGKLEAARDKVRKGELVAATKIYDSLLAGKASESVKAEAKDVRARAIAELVGTARAAIDRGDTSSGSKRLLEAVRLSDLEARAAIETAVQKLEAKPSEGISALEGTGLSSTDEILKTARALAQAAARKILASAKALASKNPTKALAAVAEISSFSDAIPEIASLRKELLSKSFAGLLDAATEAAERGNDSEASNLLGAALKATKVPDAMLGPMKEGTASLAAKQPYEAEKSFSKALAAAPRSKLAEAALAIARMRRTAAERDALDVLRSGKGDREGAVGALEASLAADPANAAAAEGSTLLAESAKKAGASGTDKELALLLGGAARLASASGPDPSFARGLGELESAQHAKAEASFGQSQNAIASLARELARAKALTSLKSNAKSVNDDASAQALGKLLATDPNDVDAAKSLAELISRAESRAKAGDDPSAAKALRFATIATRPAPGLKTALDKAIDALERGDVIECERRFGEASDLEPAHAVAKPGLELARSLRKKALEDALSAYEKNSAEILPLKSLFEKSFALDPMGDVTKEAYGEILELATKLSRSSLLAAAALLDAANVVTKPEQAKTALKNANASLAKDPKVALEAYEKVLEGAKSKVAETGLAIAKERVEGTQKTGIAELEKGGDLDRGADATQEVLKVDPTNAEARRAIDKAIERAKEADQKGDLSAALKLLRAANRARGSDATVASGLDELEKNELEKAEATLSSSTEDPVASAAALMARRRRTKALEAGLSGDDKAAAENIRKLLEADPGHKEAKKALEAFLSRAEAAGKKGDVEGAANALDAAKLATSPSGTLLEKLEEGLERLRSKDFVAAEAATKAAVEASKDSRVAATAFSVSKGRRLAEETLALAAIVKEDPIPHAKRLADSLKLENKGYGPVTKALAICQKNAEQAGAKGDDAALARALECAAILEQIGTDPIASAAQKLAAGSHKDAEEELRAANEGAPSTTAALGQKLARARRVARLKEALDAAKKEGNAARTHDLVGEILSLSPDDKSVKGMAGSASKDLVEKRAAAAKAHLEAGRVGLAHFEFSRALELDASHAGAKLGVADAEKALSDKLDLIIVVERVSKKAPGCPDLEGALGAKLMSAGSERADLGGFVLSAKWTEAAEKKVEGAPTAGAGLGVSVTACQTGPATGKLELEWRLRAPRENTKDLATGTFGDSLPAGLVLRDEQDAKGQNAQRLLVDRAAAKLLDEVAEQKDKVALWPLIVAEQAVDAKDPVAAADAYAKLLLRKKLAYDTDRANAVRTFLVQSYE